MPKIPASTIYQVEVSLQEVEPPVWRAIQVTADYSFWELHVTIQDAMGWEGMITTSTDSH